MEKLKGHIKTRRFYLMVASVLVIVSVIVFVLVNGGHKVTSQGISERRLNTSISNDYSNNSLSADLAIVQKAVNQGSKDLGLAKQGLGYVPLKTQNKEKIRRQAQLKFLRTELSAANYLSPKQLSVLRSQISSVTPNRTSSLSSQYPAFILLLPKVELIKVADDQSVSEKLFGQLEANLTKAITAASKQGVATTDLQADMTTLSSDVDAASAVAGNLEATLSSSQNLDSKQLAIYYQSVSVAQNDLNAAANASSAIINILKSS